MLEEIDLRGPAMVFNGAAVYCPVEKRLIEEPLTEKMIAKDIPVLEEISDDVSLKVREQYEENPYPRWVKLHVPIKAKPIAVVCDELKLQLHSENIKNVDFKCTEFCKKSGRICE